MDKALKPNAAILLLSCPDRAGLVAEITRFIFERQGNIINLDQHVDSESNTLFMRIEWSLSEADRSDRLQILQDFSGIGWKIQASWQIEFKGLARARVALFVSKYSHCLNDLLWRQEMGELDCDFPLIISNHPDLETTAKTRGIPYHVFSITPETKRAQEDLEMELLREYKIDLVVLARYMQILTEKFVQSFPQKIINIHHSFLPAFAGGNPYKQALERGVKIIGATSHYASEVLDQGPIIHQAIVQISHRDSLEDLVCKGRDLERITLARAVRWHLEGRVLVHGKKTVVFES
ncbi:MAG: formyltetrahydrofolate deformylase [Candidatus Caenarcaniphilales bacterium]|nr:formyltetrahydrofolate deformylase [Candidatus Caenarcaniphilales bacterium]